MGPKKKRPSWLNFFFFVLVPREEALENFHTVQQFWTVVIPALQSRTKGEIRQNSVPWLQTRSVSPRSSTQYFSGVGLMRHRASVWNIINNQFCSFKLSAKANFCRNEYNVRYSLVLLGPIYMSERLLTGYRSRVSATARVAHWRTHATPL